MTNDSTRELFRLSLRDYLNSLKKQGLSANALDKLTENLYVGLNQQIYNTPVDIFAEEFLFHEFSELRPHQYISLYMNLQEGIQAATTEGIREVVPAKVALISNIYNLLKAFHFKDLFGVDVISDFQATEFELRQAHNMFREFTEYRQEKNPGDEYRLISSWAKSLEVDTYFNLVPEAEYRSQTPLSGHLDEDAAEPESAHQKAQMDKFQKSAAEAGFNMAVVMYMVDALQYFSGMAKDSIKKAALEIAMLGMKGIQPDKQGYKVNAVPGKSFSGYHLLAYYYVTFALALPEMVSQLGLPYDSEYAMAIKMAKK